MNRYGIRVSAAEAERGRLTRDSGEEADRVFRLMGFAVIENAIPIDVIESAKRVFLERFEPYFDGNDHEDALTVGHRRVMLTVPLEPPFDDPRLFAPPCVLHVLRGLLGKRFVLGGFGAVAALPGSELQHRHTDHPRLFGDDQLDNLLPPYAITVITPLIQLTEATGTTHMWVGSHRMPRELAKLGQSALPYPPLGSVVLMDRRVLHAGTPNESDEVRPILYSEYCRPWCLDYVNYRKQDPLIVPQETLDAAEPEHLKLLARARNRAQLHGDADSKPPEHASATAETFS